MWNAALRSLRVPNCSAQASETEGMKESRRPPSGLTSTKLTAVTLDEQALQPRRDIGIDLPKLGGGIARAEVGAPATQYRVQLRDGLAQVPMTDAARGARLHALANPTH